MSEMKEKPKLKLITLLLSIGIVANIGINAYLYNQFVSNNKSITGIQKELKNIQSEYEGLSLKIKNGK